MSGAWFDVYDKRKDQEEIPQAGKTLAVDPEYIPRVYINGAWKRGYVEIDGLGGVRRAEDAGGGIIGYDIDVYMGIGQNSMFGWGNHYRKVKLISISA